MPARMPSPARAALFAVLPLAVLALLALAPAALASPITTQNGGSPNAEDIRTLYNLILAIAIVVFVGVEGVLIYCLVKYRARKGNVAAQIHGNTRLEVGWTVGAALILVFITAVTFIKLDDIKNPPASDIDAQGNPIAANVQVASTDQPDPPDPANALNIKVDGQQYVWRYQYPGDEKVFSYETMVVPVGRTVTLDISSDDVMHSFWIPALAGKMDAVPGYINKLWFKAQREGTFVGQCAELCGRNHANMYARVEAVPNDEYLQWYREQAAAIEEAEQEGARQRQELERSQGEQAAQGGGSAGGASDDQ